MVVYRLFLCYSVFPFFYNLPPTKLKYAYIILDISVLFMFLFGFSKIYVNSFFFKLSLLTALRTNKIILD